MSSTPRFKESDKVVSNFDGRVYVVEKTWESPQSTEGWFIKFVGRDSWPMFWQGEFFEIGFRPSDYRLLSEVQAENCAKRERLDDTQRSQYYQCVDPDYGCDTGGNSAPDPDNEGEDWKRTDDSPSL